MARDNARDFRLMSAALATDAVRVGARAAVVVRKVSADIEADAKALAPVDTGNLRASISREVTGDGRTRSIRAEIGPSAHYAGHVEYGTTRMAPQPYLGPATDRHAPAFTAGMEQAADPRL